MKRSFYWPLAIAGLITLSACSYDDNQAYTVQNFIQGAAFNGTVSVNFSPDNELFIIDAFSKRIVKIDQQSGEVLESLTEKVDGPADLDFAPDGTLYWVNIFSGEVYKRTTEGVVSLVAELNTVVDGITVNAEGRIFTASFVPGEDALWELDPLGVQPPRVVVELGGFDAFDFGPDGYLYAPDYLNGTGQVYRIDVDTGEVKVIADGFCQPISTKFSQAGELYVLDHLCPQVVKVDVTTGAKTLIAEVDAGADNFAFNQQDELFIAFNADSYIGKVNNDGSVDKITRGGVSAPGGIAIRPDGSLFVSDVFGLRRFDAASGELQQSFYTDDGIIPALSLYDDGQYLITTSHLFGGFVQVWNPSTGTAVETHVDFQQPINAIRFRDEVIVADMGIGSVVTLNGRTPLIEGLKVPAGLAANGDDLYVGDWETGTIWKAVEAGVSLNPPQAVVENLSKPEGIAFDNEGRLLVVEVGNKRLIRIDFTDNSTFVIAEDLALGLEPPKGAAPTWVALSSVAVSSSGALYVTSDVDNLIYKIEENK